VIGGFGVVLCFNLIVGLSSAEPIAWAFATAAFWGLVVLWFAAIALWPLLLDPVRSKERVTDLVRLAALVVLVRPLRFLVLAAVLTVTLVLSTLLFVALITISVAYMALVSARYVLPAADRLEGRATKVVPTVD
jgi:hypothetical protein